jgi:Cytochrome c7 and related cytochrome c
MRIGLQLAAVAIPCLTLGWSQVRPAESDSFEPKPAPPQPIPFSHKTHSGLGIQCLDCHPVRPPGDLADFPKETACMGCHASVKADSPAIQKLADFAAQKKRVPWVRVYRLPRMVYFSHEVHHKKAAVECAVCHGPVATRDSLGQEKSIEMTACMKCHDQYKVSNDCNLCHDTQ